MRRTVLRVCPISSGISRYREFKMSAVPADKLGWNRDFPSEVAPCAFLCIRGLFLYQI